MIPKIKITERGLKAPEPTEVLEGGKAVLKAAFGDNINTDVRTPQGQLNTTLTAEYLDLNNKLIDLFNQVDPRYARGFMQEAIGHIYMMHRKKGAKSVVQLTFTGRTGVVVPNGFIVSGVNGDKWETIESNLIQDGKCVVNAQSVKSGRIIGLIGSITTIENETSGIDSVTNLTPAITGFDVESREDFEQRRQKSVYKNSWGMTHSVLGEVLDLPDVLNCVVIHNPTDKTVTAGVTKYSLPPHSLLCSVVGGNDYDIGSKVIENGGTGCQFVGNREITYIDPSSSEYPQIEYKVKFLRPTHINTFFTVIVDDIDQIGYDQEQFIKQQIIDNFRSGKLQACINSRVVANRYMCTIQGIDNNIIIDILIGRSKEERKQYIDFGIDEFPVVDESLITIEGVK